MISPTQRPLPDNTRDSQYTDIHVTAGFEPVIPASERPQTHALDRAATGIGKICRLEDKNKIIYCLEVTQFILRKGRGRYGGDAGKERGRYGGDAGKGGEGTEVMQERERKVRR